MVILLNKNANNGKGYKKWLACRDELEEKFLGRDYQLISNGGDIRAALRKALSGGESVFVAAGGDGTVNFLLNQVMQLSDQEKRKIILGAIGLGSSNDFHKPFSPGKSLSQGIPFKLEHGNALYHNIGQVDYIDASDSLQRKYFIINSSVGIVAQANYLFNSKEKIVNWLKSRWVLGTIWYAGLKTILFADNIPARLHMNRETIETKITNLSVVINPHFSGNLCYDFDVCPQSHYFGVALCENMKVREKMRTLFSLARSQFTGLPKTRIWRTPQVAIETEVPTALELDGEVMLARHIRIMLLKGVLKACP